jgi:hypothetical protein
MPEKKTIEVTIFRRVYTTYEVEVPKDFDVNDSDAIHKLEEMWIEGEFTDEDQTFEEVGDWEIDSVEDNNDSE